MAILEYCSENLDYTGSYAKQIKRYGADPLLPSTLIDMFPGRKVDAVDLEPYVLMLVEAKND